MDPTARITVLSCLALEVGQRTLSFSAQQGTLPHSAASQRSAAAQSYSPSLPCTCSVSHSPALGAEHWWLYAAAGSLVLTRGDIV